MNPEIWRDVFDVIEDPVFLHDAQFRVLQANRAYCHAAGVPEAQALGKPYWEVFPPGTGPLPGCREAVIEKRITNSLDEVRVGAELFLSKGYTVRDDQGHFLYALHLLSDITAQRQATATLLESEKRFRRAIDTARDAIITIDGASGLVTAWNSAAEAMFGYSREEMIGRVLHEIIVPPRLRDAAMKGLAHFATTGDGAAIGQTLELVALRKDGTEFPIELSLSAMQLHGKWQATGIVRDISARKRAEEAVLRAGEEFHMLFDSIADAIFIHDMDGHFLQVNDAACERLGYSREELLRKRVTDIDAPQYAAQVPERIKALQERGRLVFESVHVRKDGGVFPVELNVRVITYAGKPALLSVARDISARQQAQAAIQHANRALATLSAVNHHLVHAASEDELLQAICLSIVEQSGYQLAWVGYAQHDEPKSIKVMAISDPDEDYAEVIQPTWAASELGMGPSGRAIRSGTTQLCQDIANDPLYRPWREEALKRGYAASIALPLLTGDHTVIGNLTVYATQANAFTPPEVALLEEMAGDLAFGVRTLHTRRERDLALAKNQEQLAQLQDSLEDTVRAIATMVEMRDPYTAGHQVKVADLAVAIARQMGLTDEQMHAIHLAGVVHDLGKIRVPAEILSMPGSINDAEFSLIKAHPQTGYEILKGINFPWPIALMVLQHHERFDGSGYPQGLKGDAILLEARILGVADVVEAMSSHRPYRPGLGIEAALQEIERGRGSAYDPAVVDACLKLFREERFTFQG